MTKRIVVLLVLLVVIGSVLPVPAIMAQAPQARYIVVFTASRLPHNASALVEAAGGQVALALPQVGVAIATSSDPNFAEAMAQTRGVLAVDTELAYRLPPLEHRPQDGPVPGVDVFYQSGLQWDIQRVRADGAWELGVIGSHDTVVAVIDTGIAWNHPDLAPNVIFHTCYAVDLIPCTDYPNGNFPDDAWHGTHVAGTVAAAFGGGAAVGVGPNLGLASYNTFEWIDGCGFCTYFSSVFQAMLDAAARGFDVINLSLGGLYLFPQTRGDGAALFTATQRIAQYVTQQGVTIVAAAGNEDFNLNGPVYSIPADVSAITSVGATGIRPLPLYPQAGAYDVRAFYSNYGAAVDLAAPGGDCGLDDGCDRTIPDWFTYLVLSTFVVLDPGCAATQSCPPSYTWAGGTSMASPHVAGVAGLVKDHNPRLNPNQVASILTRTAENLGDRQLFGHGMVNAEAAVSAR